MSGYLKGSLSQKGGVLSLFALTMMTAAPAMAENFIPFDPNPLTSNIVNVVDGQLDKGCYLQGPIEYRVDSFKDAVDGKIGDCRCLTDDDECTLRAAIQEANAYRNGPITIYTGSGNFVLSLTGRDDDASFAGDLDIIAWHGHPYTIKGVPLENGRTIIDGGSGGLYPRTKEDVEIQNRADRVFHIFGNNVTFKHLTIQHGNADVGGGIEVDYYSDLTIDNSIVRWNLSQHGGGIDVVRGNLTVNDSLIHNNFASQGGGINCVSYTNAHKVILNRSVIGAGAFDYFRNPQLDNSRFSTNGNAAWTGGGIKLQNCAAEITASHIERNGPALEWEPVRHWVEGTFGTTGGGIYGLNSPITIKRSSILYNASIYGGGIYLDRAPPGSVISESDIRLNQADFGGAGVYNSGNLAIHASSIRENSLRDTAKDELAREVRGAGIYNAADAYLFITESTINNNYAISANMATEGGGIYNDGSASFVNSTISANSANAGGGIYEDVKGNDGSSVQLNNVTITKNRANTFGGKAGEGGGIFGYAVLSNTIVAENSDASGNGPDCRGSLNSAGYNLIGYIVIGRCKLSGSGETDIAGNSNSETVILPGLGLLADNDGQTQTHALLFGSPAIDKGNPAPVANWQNRRDGDYSCEDVSQNAKNRPQGPRCDIGAYERPEIVLQDGDPVSL